MSDLKISTEAKKAAEDVLELEREACSINVNLSHPKCKAELEIRLQSHLNEACRPLVEALEKWEVQDDDGNYPDERADYTPTLSPIARRVIDAHRKEHGP